MYIAPDQTYTVFIIVKTYIALVTGFIMEYKIYKYIQKYR